MIVPGSGVRVYLAYGVMDKRKGIYELAQLAQDVLRHKPAGGAAFAMGSTSANNCYLEIIFIKYTI